MCTPLLVLALSGVLSTLNKSEAPKWLDDYAAARQQGQSDKKPLAVFLGPGKSAWDQLAKEGKLGKENQRILALNYVCVYVDTKTKFGRRLASALEIDEALGIVISDASGEYMAFHHEGDLAKQDLERYLKRYADPNRLMTATETNPPRYAQSWRGPEVDWSQHFAPAITGGRRC